MSWFSVAKALDGVKYKDWELRNGVEDNGRHYFQWIFQAKCCKTGLVCEQRSRKWHLSQWMTDSEVVGTAFKAALTAEEHEARESFTWHGRRVFGPHIDVQSLWYICEQEDVRDIPA